MVEIFFPYKKVRAGQKELIEDMNDVLLNKKNLIAHAPTGLGKTAAVLSPALTFTNKNDFTIFFLTSRHSQHHIAIDTLREIREKYDLNFNVADIIGKQWMCSQDNVEGLYSSEFNEYCKALREDNKCEFFLNVKNKNKLTLKGKKILEDIKKLGPSHSEKIIELCKKEKLCPYEVSTLLAKEAKVIIADYYYVFHPKISLTFFNKIDKELEKSILIIDEGHNLPKRIRDLQSSKLSTFILERAIKEAEKYNYDKIRFALKKISVVLQSLTEKLEKDKEERLVDKKEFEEKINKIKDYDELIADLTLAGDEIREKQRSSFIGSVGAFLDSWLGQDKGFVRILNYRWPFVTLSYKCLDPSLLTKDIIENSYSTILMSGTLTPTSMYKDLLGFENTVEKEYISPFPEENRLAMIIPHTTTRFNQRNEEQYEKIAKVCSEITNLIPGHVAIFFPSYLLRDDVNKFLDINKNIILEEPRSNKHERKKLLEKFKKEKDSVLLAVASGSFGEGIDIKGNLLKCVIVVGIPLTRPDLETNELIEYYNKKFNGKGRDYGYILPAVLKSLQNAGRCIRKETDRGVMIFLDERYAWDNYLRCFPKDWKIKITRLFDKKIKEFFS